MEKDDKDRFIEQYNASETDIDILIGYGIPEEKIEILFSVRNNLTLEQTDELGAPIRPSLEELWCMHDSCYGDPLKIYELESSFDLSKVTQGDELEASLYVDGSFAIDDQDEDNAAYELRKSFHLMLSNHIILERDEFFDEQTMQRVNLLSGLSLSPWSVKLLLYDKYSLSPSVDSGSGYVDKVKYLTEIVDGKDTGNVEFTRAHDLILENPDYVQKIYEKYGLEGKLLKSYINAVSVLENTDFWQEFIVTTEKVLMGRMLQLKVLDNLAMRVVVEEKHSLETRISLGLDIELLDVQLVDHPMDDNGQIEKDENSIPGIDDYHLQFNAPELIDYVKELCSVVTSELQNMADKKKEKAIKDDLEFLEGLNEDILKDAETEEERQLMIDVQQEIEEMKKPDYDGLDKVMVSPEMLDNLTEIMLSPSKNYSAEEHEEDLNLFFGWAIRYDNFKSFTLDDVLKRYGISKDVLQKRGIYDDFIFAWDIYR